MKEKIEEGDFVPGNHLVECNFLDLRPRILQNKIDYIKGVSSKEHLQGVIEATEYSLARWLGRLREKSPNDTDGQKILRDLIDFQYKETQKIFHFEFYLYVILFLMPLIFQQYSEDPMYIIGFNYWCLLIQLMIGA